MPCYKWIKPFRLKCFSFHVSSQAAIRKELNEFKSAEMEVHEESRIYTRSGLYTAAINNSPQLFLRFIQQSHQYFISSVFSLRICWFIYLLLHNLDLLDLFRLFPPGSIGLSCPHWPGKHLDWHKSFSALWTEIMAHLVRLFFFLLLMQTDVADNENQSKQSHGSVQPQLVLTHTPVLKLWNWAQEESVGASMLEERAPILKEWEPPLPPPSPASLVLGAQKELK